VNPAAVCNEVDVKNGIDLVVKLTGVVRFTCFLKLSHSNRAMKRNDSGSLVDNLTGYSDFDDYEVEPVPAEFLVAPQMQFEPLIWKRAQV